MSKNTPAVKNLDSYSLLQKKMKEVEKSKKPTSRSSGSGSSYNNQKRDEKKTDYAPEQPTKESSKVTKQDIPLDPDEPDRSYGDYFCRTCDSHMNSSDMWIAHVTGKRHIKNVKKGDTDSKYDNIDAESAVNYEIKNVKDAIIGLDYIHEIRRREPGIPPIYSCFLCHASISTVPLVIEHVIGLKHRSNFLKENDPDGFKLLEQTCLKKGFLEPIIAEKALKFEEKYGRGEVKVKQEKPKAPYTGYKRSNDSDEEDQPSYKKSFKQKSDGAPAVWKSIDITKKDYRDEFDNRRDKKNYFQHDNRSVDDEYKRSRSYKDSRLSEDRDGYRRPYSRSPDRDDYRRLVDYPRQPDDYLRSVSPGRYGYDKSPVRDLPSSSSKRLVLNEKFSPTEFSDARHYLEARSQDRIMQSSASAVGPPAPKPTTSETTEKHVMAFVNQLYSLPPKLFLKVIKSRLDHWTAFDLDKEEMEYLLKIDVVCKNIIKRSLPPEIQAMIKDTMTQKLENMQGAPSTSLYQSGHQPPNAQNPPSSHKFTMDDINELVFGARKASELSAPHQQPPHMPPFNHAPNISGPNSQTFSGPPQPANFMGGPGPVPPPANFPPQGGNFPPTTNNFPPPANTLPHPGNFGSKPNNFTSPNKGTRFTNFPNPNSGIPGLTLTENEGAQNSSPNEFPPQFRWSGPNRNRREPFNRY